MWTTLIMTLSTQPNAVRLRVWRGLKAIKCSALRDGAYLLPAAQAGLFEDLAAELRAHGGSALLMDLTARNEAQRLEILALFDRSEAYGQWRDHANALQAELPSFVLDADRALTRLAQLVHFLAVGSIPVAELAGLRGLRRSLCLVRHP